MKKQILSVAMIAALTACAGTPQPLPREGVAHRWDATNAPLGEREPAYADVDAPWLGGRQLERRQTDSLPSIMQEPVTYRRMSGTTLAEAVEFVISTYGVSVSVTEEARQKADAIQRPAPMAVLANLPPLPGDDENGSSLMQQGGMQGQDTGGGMFRLSYTGTLKGFLDELSARTGNAWRWENDRVVIFHTESRVFALNVLPGTVTMQGSVSNQAQGGGSGGGAGGGGGGGGGGGETASSSMESGSSTSLDLLMNPLQSIEEGIASLLSEKGKASGLDGMGQVVVTDVPEALDRVAKFLDNVNEVAMRQVMLDVQLFSVERDRTDQSAIQWDAVWSSIGSNLGLNLLSGSTFGEGAQGQAYVLNEDSRFGGTRLLLEALSRAGDVEQVTSASVVTLSGRPVPIQVGEEITYIESAQITLVPNVGQQVTRTPAKLTTGFSMALLPILTDRENLLLQAQVNLSTLRELRRIGSENDGEYIETPLVDSRQFMQHVALRSGQTLVLTGFEQETLRSDAAGVGTPSFRLLGGSKRNESRRSTLVMFITPRVVSR